VLFSIIICTHNRCELLKVTIESLLEIKIPNGVGVEIVVVLNSCSDGSAKMLREYPTVRQVVENRIGLCVARNRGVVESNGRIVAFLDDDIKVDANWLIKYIDAFMAWGADGASGQVVLWWAAVKRPVWYNSSLHGWALSEFDRGSDPYLMNPGDGIGANFAFTRESINRLGPFLCGLDRSGESLAAGGDTEYFTRAHKSEMRIVYSAAKVEHWVKPDRLLLKTFGRLGYQQGKALVLMKPKIAIALIWRSLAGYSGLIFLHSIPLIWSILRKNPSGSRHHLSRLGCGIGGIVGWIKRLG